MADPLAIDPDDIVTIAGRPHRCVDRWWAYPLDPAVAKDFKPGEPLCLHSRWEPIDEAESAPAR